MRGISPIVAIVLMIAVAVVASTGVYFFSAGIATKEKGTDSDSISKTPLSATVVDSQNGVILLQNLGSNTLEQTTLQVAGVNTKGCVLDDAIEPGEQGICRMTGFEGTATVFMPSGGSAVIKAPAGDTNPRFIAFMKPNGDYQAGVEPIANEIYAWLVSQGYDVTNVTRLNTTEELAVFDLIVIGPDAAYFDLGGGV